MDGPHTQDFDQPGPTPRISTNQRQRARQAETGLSMSRAKAQWLLQYTLHIIRRGNFFGGDFLAKTTPRSSPLPLLKFVARELLVLLTAALLVSLRAELLVSLPFLVHTSMEATVRCGSLRRASPRICPGRTVRPRQARGSVSKGQLKLCFHSEMGPPAESC